ncbi:hypothetical protein CBR_g32118 [Chara braunii]|uniref:DUF659 domain-containing protein n=1 Tax=Chara braunii TaxID=69332 RepID=A0A388LGN3_CHABU|nr:hypothetical protein CBR_g32118 [Chara braunii]|eukprot:GBG81441.1 hypothetical protein CBR_g32118 [Chara braunii]
MLKDPLSQRLAAERAQTLEEGLATEDELERDVGGMPKVAATQAHIDGEDNHGEEVPPQRDATHDVRDRLRADVGMGAEGDEAAIRVQKDLDRLLALAMYRGGVPFNWLRLKETHDYWDYIVTLLRPSIVPVPRLLSYEEMRTRMLDIIFHEVAALIAPKKVKWADTECTLLTDGATDQTNKSIMNFIAAGKSGSVLIRTIDMSEREKTDISLAQIWESVIRDDIGVDHVNAICTDNVKVMKTVTAASILQSHSDLEIARILWIPCAAHCLSLLLRDIVAQPWAQLVMKQEHKIVKFMRNKQKAQTLHRKVGVSLNLKRPADTRFGTAYMMLERLWDQREVLDSVVSYDAWKRLRWAGDARADEPEVHRLCKSDRWWKEVKRIMDVMEPCYTFLRAMDRDGSSPSGLWDLESILIRMIDTLQLPTGERADLLTATRRPDYRYIDVWFDMVEDPPKEVDDADVIPPDVDEQDWEVVDRANRRKDSLRDLRARVGGHVDMEGLLSRDDAEDEEEHRHEDVIASTCGMERGGASSSQCPATSDCEVIPERSHGCDVGGEDATVEDPPRSVTIASVASIGHVVGSGGSVEGTMHRDTEDNVRERAKGDADQRGAEQVEDSGLHRQRVEQTRQQTIHGVGVRQSVKQTVHPRMDPLSDAIEHRPNFNRKDVSEQRTEKRAVDNAEQRLHVTVDPLKSEGANPAVVQSADQSVGGGLDAAVEQRAN